MEQFKNVAACGIGVHVSSKNKHETVLPGQVIECEEKDVARRLAKKQFERIASAEPAAPAEPASSKKGRG